MKEIRDERETEGEREKETEGERERDRGRERERDRQRERERERETEGERERETSSWKRTEIRQFTGQCRRLIAHRDIWFSVPQRLHFTVPALFWPQPTALDCCLIRQVPIPQSFCPSVYQSIYYCLAGNEKRIYLSAYLSVYLFIIVSGGGGDEKRLSLSTYLFTCLFMSFLIYSKFCSFFLHYSHRNFE